MYYLYPKFPARKIFRAKQKKPVKKELFNPGINVMLSGLSDGVR